MANNGGESFCLLKVKNNKLSIESPKNSLQNQYELLSKQLQPIENKLRDVSRDKTLNKRLLDSLSKKYYAQIIDLKKNYIQENPQSHISLYLLFDLIRLGRLLSYHEHKDLYNLMNVETHQGNAMLDFIQKELQTIEASRIIGKTAPAFSLTNQHNKTVTLEDFKGNYTLLDFWASWCAPCRAANKKVMRLYQKYKEKGFQVISISFDYDKEKWLKAIEEDQITWTQISDLKGFYKSEIKKLYHIESLPTTYVLNPEGKAIEQNLKHHELEQFLETIY